MQISVLTPAARSWLSSEASAAVLHVFPNVCNLINESRSVLSLVLQEAALSPSSMLVAHPLGLNADEWGFDERIDVNSRIEKTNEGLRIGANHFSIDGARIWSPLVDWDDCPQDHVLAYLPLIESELRSTAPPDSLVNFISEDPLSGKSGIIQSACRSFQSGLKSSELGEIANSSRMLAGLGPGLTPSGDDFLLGSIFAMWVVDKVGLRKIIELVVSKAAPNTTALSAAWLRAAKDGEAGIVWHWLFSSIANENDADVIRFSRQMAKTGHTSGADALAGFIMTVKLLAGS
jgi:hypothetical protein